MKRRPTIIFLPDGMADEPMHELDDRTPLQAAHTPAMDSMAREGCCGTLLTLPEGYPTSSDVANMSVLGCDVTTDYCGRGPLEAAGRGIPVGPHDTVFRVNLVTTEADTLTDFSGGHVAPAPAAQLIDLLNAHLATDTIRFHSGVSYRNLLMLSGDAYTGDIDTDKPDDNYGQAVADHLPRARASAASQHTAEVLRDLIARAAPILGDSAITQALVAEGHPPVNGIWPWSGGRVGNLQTLQEKFGIRSAVISAVDVIMGLGTCLGMDTLNVPGATGYIDTNYEGKADAAIHAIETYDLVYLHVEAIDEVSHAMDLEKKLMAIEDFDRRVVARVLEAVGDRIDTVVLPDHPVPLRLGKHTRTPVPVAVRREGYAADSVSVFDEVACPTGTLGALKNGDLMRLLFG